MRAQIKSFNLLLHSCLFMKWNTDYYLLETGGFGYAPMNIDSSVCVCVGGGVHVGSRICFTWSTRWGCQTWDCAACVWLLEISFPLSSLEPRAQVAIAQWSDHMALGFSEDSLACNLSSVLNWLVLDLQVEGVTYWFQKKCCMKIEALTI